MENSCDQPVKGFDTEPVQSRLALINTWLITQPPNEWSLKPLCINESQNSLPWVDVFCENEAGKAKRQAKNKDNKIFRCFMAVALTNILIVFSPIHASSLELLLDG